MSIGILGRYWPDPVMNFILEHLPIFLEIISFNLEEEIEKRHKSSSKEKGGKKYGRKLEEVEEEEKNPFRSVILTFGDYKTLGM